MPDKEVERQIAIVFKFGDAWHRGFKLDEHDGRHLMLWENCPLHDGPGQLIPDILVDKLPDEVPSHSLCVVCFAS